MKSVFNDRGSKPSSMQLSGGSIGDAEVQGKFEEYWNSYGEGAGEGIVQEMR